jgi:hypothetical protein
VYHTGAQMKRGNCPHTDLFIAADCKKIIIFINNF